ncbi:MraY family glycosyltransferase [Eremococcus coleocola]|uniref:Glycosyltransferase, group 4 family n=1 Tax=Eremococcus coleocola ACS-139-V-Col8 TaxID=908337 RepID=E4KNM5_9LACT|nr:MraY family glycosyltransferase [Eremococcus coleocola]EFR31455.1 glycosyltransferase, group 4 family [Eremococcus coleocola ACS-139-V-Col8]
MGPLFSYAALAWFLATIFSLLLLWLGKKSQVYDQDVHDLKNHRQVVTLGGLGIYFAFWTAFYFFNPSFFLVQSLLALFLASTLVLITGILDDLYNLKPWLKSAGVLLAANIIYFWANVSFSTTLLPTVSDSLFQIITYLLTMVWIFLMTNAINLIDGLDGLASSVTLISLITLIVTTYFFSISISLSILVMLLILSGAILGFIPFNWQPAKIYLGDTGALFIGFMYASLSVTNLKNASFYSLAVPVLIYLVPLFDAFFAVLRRFMTGKSIVVADHDHVHHRLLRLGLKEWQVVAIMIFITLLFSSLAILTQLFASARQYILMGAMALVLLLLLIMIRINKTSKKD